MVQPNTFVIQISSAKILGQIGHGFEENAVMLAFNADIQPLHPVLIYEEHAGKKDSGIIIQIFHWTSLNQHSISGLSFFPDLWHHFGSHHPFPIGSIPFLAEKDKDLAFWNFQEPTSWRNMIHCLIVFLDFPHACPYLMWICWATNLETRIPWNFQRFLVASNLASAQGTLLLGKACPDLRRLRAGEGCTAHHFFSGV